MSKVLYCTDIHGDEKVLYYLVRAYKRTKADLLVLGADVLPKTGGDIVEVQRDFLSSCFPEFVDRCKTAGVKLFACGLGNDDLAMFDNVFWSILQDAKVLCTQIGDIHLLSLKGIVKEYPFGLKDRCRRDNEAEKAEDIVDGKRFYVTSSGAWTELTKEDWITTLDERPTIAAELERLHNQVDKSIPNENRILVAHQPPSNCGLDVCWGGKKVGSNAILDFFKKHKYGIGLFGHIHESPYVFSGSTHHYLQHGDDTSSLLVNPGDTEVVLIDTDKRSIDINPY